MHLICLFLIIVIGPQLVVRIAVEAPLCLSLNSEHFDYYYRDETVGLG